MKKRLVFGIVGAILAGLAAPAGADVLRLRPSEVTVVKGEGDAVLVDVSFRVDGLRAGANRKVVATYLEWRVEGLDGEKAPAFAVQPAAARPGPTSETWNVVDRETALDVEAIGPSRLARAGGYLRLDVAKLGWDDADGTTRRLSVLATGVDPQSVARQIDGLELVIRYAFLPEELMNLFR